jgi:hypothetical protein
MNTKIIVIFLIFYALASKAQNLVLNESFEQKSICPDQDPSDISVCYFWFNPTSSSPDYFDSCASYISGYSVPSNGLGYQIPKDSSAYMGIFAFDKNNADVRDYIATALSDTLAIGIKYYCSFYVSLSNFCSYSVQSLGIYFTATQPSVSNYLAWNITPQIENKNGNISDTVNWVLVADTFTAIGGEKYITIGNFRSDSMSDTVNFNAGFGNMAYYYIDAVTVIPYEQVEGTDQDIFSQVAVSVFPNPADEKINFKFNRELPDIVQLEFFELNGRTIKTLQIPPHSKNYEYLLDGISRGVYFYRIKADDRIIKTGKVILLGEN